MASVQQALSEYKAGRLDAALSIAKEALASANEGEQSALVILLSNICLKLGKKGEAAEYFVAAARMLPEKRAAFLKFAIELYRDEGDSASLADIAGEAAEAISSPDLLYELASALQACGRLDEAEAFISRLDFSKSRHFMLLNAFGAALGNPGRFSEFLFKACMDQPGDVYLKSARFALAQNLCDFPAMEEFGRLVDDSDSPLALSLLENELAYSRLLRSSDEGKQILPSYDERALLVSGGNLPLARRAFSPPGARIRIGYLSSDFFQHVTMRLFEEVMQQHDRERFDIKLFCYTDDTKRAYQVSWPPILRDSVIHVGDLSNAAAAGLIDTEGVDILVDLKGYTQGARLGIVRQSTAPVKVTYLGFPGPVRAADLDYVISDAIVTPDGSAPFYEEKFCRLPDTYQANGSCNRVHPAPLSRSELGLPEERVVLGSFNTPGKLSPAVMQLWAKILKRLPDAVLNMLCSDDTARRNVLHAFEAAGVDAGQVIFFAKEAYPRFLARIAAADIALDSFPYNGHTTSSDVLWMGTPLVALRGSHFAGRVSQSLLSAIGLSELAVESAEAYCDLAVELARNAEKRDALRQRLQENRLRFPLFDTERFTRHLERAYEIMAGRARKGLPPDHVDVEALPARQGTFMP